jgi:aminoglycoside phosphotransferase (APT) family kinase protein
MMTPREIAGSSGFAPQRIETHLRDTLPGLRGPMRIAPLGDHGLSYRVGFEGRSLLLRIAPPAGAPAAPPQLAARDTVLRRECHILAALAANGVPAPKTLLVCDDPQVAGAPFYVAALPEGRVFSGDALPELAPAQRRGVYFALAETLACLHRVDWAAAGLADNAGPGHFFAREVAYWNRQLALRGACRGSGHGAPQPGLARVGDWLAAHVPDDDDSAILHGDIRLGNVVFDPGGTQVLALCGWQRATLGHPLADAARSCLPWQLTREAAGIRDLDLARHGLPTQAEYLTHYRRCGGHAEGVTTFHLVFALFRAVREPPGGDARHGAALVRRALELIDGASP